MKQSSTLWMGAPCASIFLWVLGLLPAPTYAQLNLSVGYSIERSIPNVLNRIIDNNNEMNSSVLITAIPHYNLFSGASAELGMDMDWLNLSIHASRLNQVVSNNYWLTPTSEYQTDLTYTNTQIGTRGEIMFTHFLGIGGSVDFNLVSIDRGNKADRSYYYTQSNNIFTEHHWSYRYHLHLQHMFNNYFALSFRPYYQQSFKPVDFSSVNEVLEKTVVNRRTLADYTAFSPPAAETLKNWGGEITLRMFFNRKSYGEN
jgi:hypothetical protein